MLISSIFPKINFKYYLGYIPKFQSFKLYRDFYNLHVDRVLR